MLYPHLIFFLFDTLESLREKSKGKHHRLVEPFGFFTFLKMLGWKYNENPLIKQ